nr:MAG TPA: hypothetical protein [Caudoviricetes sp.]
MYNTHLYPSPSLHNYTIKNTYISTSVFQYIRILRIYLSLVALKSTRYSFANIICLSVSLAINATSFYIERKKELIIQVLFSLLSYFLMYFYLYL